jgi:telomere length regulation protein
MVVGESLSGLTDAKTKKLDFHSDEMQSEEAIAYKQLVHCQDQPGSFDQLRTTVDQQAAPRKPIISKKTRPTKTVPPAKTPTRPTGFIIEEVDDDSEDDDIVPLTKPDSDPEDSDEDPTLITRNKPKPPVYVRQLIVYLRDTENYDYQNLGLTAAPSLIRRKANHGTELKEHAEELASILVGLQDKFELNDFHDLRLQSMLALLVGQPTVMGPWFGRTFFQGDYSISQRASVLTVLGLSAREIARFEESAYGPTSAFPSKKLPERVERMYLLSSRVWV